jgi:hypothetical protein
MSLHGHKLQIEVNNKRWLTLISDPSEIPGILPEIFTQLTRNSLKRHRVQYLAFFNFIPCLGFKSTILSSILFSLFNGPYPLLFYLF